MSTRRIRRLLLAAGTALVVLACAFGLARSVFDDLGADDADRANAAGSASNLDAGAEQACDLLNVYRNRLDSPQARADLAQLAWKAVRFTETPGVGDAMRALSDDLGDEQKWSSHFQAAVAVCVDAGWSPDA